MQLPCEFSGLLTSNPPQYGMRFAQSAIFVPFSIVCVHPDSHQQLKQEMHYLIMTTQKTADEQSHGHPFSIADWWKPILLLAVVAGIIVAAEYYGLDQNLLVLRDWIETHGFIGYVVFAAIYIVATVAAIPGSLFTIAAGAMFGTLYGVIIVSISATTGATLAFLVSRYIARGPTERALSKRPRFARIYNLTERKGGAMVAIARLLPFLPFNLLNYAFGLTKVHTLSFIFWTWLCMLPGIAVYVSGTDAVVKAMTQNRVPWVVIAVLIGSIIIATLLVRAFRGKVRISDKNSDSRKR